MSKIIFPMRRRGAVGTTGATGAGAASLEPRIAALENPFAGNTIYANSSAPNGGDGSLSSPFNNSTEVSAALKSGINYIRLTGDLIWDNKISINEHMTIGFYASGAASRTLTFTARNTNPNDGAGFVVGGSMRIRMQGINVVVDIPNDSGHAVFDAYGAGTIQTWWYNSNITGTASNVAYLYRAIYGSNLVITFQGTTITNMSGKVFFGVEAAANPQSQYIVTNLTSN